MRTNERVDKSQAFLNTDKPVDVSLQSLLTVGAHFGSKRETWNPKMIPFIYGMRNGVFIIDLETTLKMWKRAKAAIVKSVANGGTVMFVGTKESISPFVREEATRVNSPYVEKRWLGGTLTNFNTIVKSVGKLEQLESLLKRAESGEFQLKKKEITNLQKQITKLIGALGGLKRLKKIPDLLFVTDINHEHIAVEEAKMLRIPVVGLVDTDADPELVGYPVPANDDANSALKLFVRAVSDAVKEGMLEREAKAKAQQVEIEASKDASVVAPVKRDANITVNRVRNH